MPRSLSPWLERAVIEPRDDAADPSMHGEALALLDELIGLSPPPIAPKA